MTLNKYLFTKEYGSLYYRLSYFFKYKIPFTSHWNEYHNPIYHWWKARKVFKRPKTHFYKGDILWFFGFPMHKKHLNSFIDIRLSSIGWKDKYNSPRHEWDPYISIVFFRKYQLLWVFNWISKKHKYSDMKSMATWEALLDYLYYNKSIKECINTHVWGYRGELITIESNLK